MINLQKKIIVICLAILLISSLIVSNYITLGKSYNWSINFLTYKFNNDNFQNYKIDFVTIYLKSYSKKNYFTEKETKTTKVANFVYEDTQPTVYIYSTHSNEEYSYQKNNLYSIIPNVKTASYILKEELNNLGINVLIEEKNTIDILNSRNLPYSSAYKISRELLENAKNNNQDLKYFLDIHRDSVKKNITTVTIDNLNYARIMFVLGLENPNYKENKEVMTIINDYLNTNYVGLSRGIYEKQGSGVDGLYNQDFNKNTLLIEIGGIENTIEEVSNSVKVLAKALNYYFQTEIDNK